MRVIQKTIVDFDTINSYARTLEFLGSKKAASDLRNIKQDILSAYDLQQKISRPKHPRNRQT